MRKVDFSLVTNADARAYLREQRELINHYIRRAQRWHWDEAEVRSVVEVAVVEALATYETKHATKLNTWTHRVIRWRLSELRASRRGEHQARQHMVDRDGEEYTIEYASHEPSPEENAAHLERMRWLDGAMRVLTPRESAVLAARLNGETGVASGSALGVTRQCVQQHEAHALDKLRRRARVDRQ